MTLTDKVVHVKIRENNETEGMAKAKTPRWESALEDLRLGSESLVNAFECYPKWEGIWLDGFKPESDLTQLIIFKDITLAVSWRTDFERGRVRAGRCFRRLFQASRQEMMMAWSKCDWIWFTF